MSPLKSFSPPVRAWFDATFAGPTPAQSEAWGAIASGENALVVAPTGSGKTLAAFLWSLDRLLTGPEPESKERRLRVLYVSPLKALAVDIERNLRAPLTGITRQAERTDAKLRDVQVGDPNRRHAGRRPPPFREAPARHPDHDAGVPLPDPHQPGARGLAERRDRHRRRGPRDRRQQTRRASGAVARAPGRAARQAGPARRPERHGAPGRRGRALPRRRPRRHGGSAEAGEELGPPHRGSRSRTWPRSAARPTTSSPATSCPPSNAPASGRTSSNASPI